MKFVISKDLEHSKLLNTLMSGVSIALFFYILLDMFLHGYLFGSDITGIKETLYGNMEEFIEPILFDTLLLQIHIDLFMTLVSLMILSTMYIRLFSDEKTTVSFIHTLFILGLISPFFLLVAYMSSALFVYLWVLTFICWHFLAIFFSIRIVKRLLRR